ncbi:hypothetical protein ABT263_22550 [Kitasatospora sp. NPDC001603]|uniref:hypothetical protein n=1 Tax=Kitasatospora sp. NPDC001603 TaxID=3154388 RepID=UPI00332A6D09
MTIRSVLVRSAVAATAVTGLLLGLAGPSAASSGHWISGYNSDRGAKVEGTLIEPTSGCDYAKVKSDGAAKIYDTDGDGNGAIAYLITYKCGTGTKQITKLGSVSGEGRSALLSSVTVYNVSSAALQVCEYYGDDQFIDCVTYG